MTFWKDALQPALATAGYIRPTAKLEVERPGIGVKCNPDICPLDVSFGTVPVDSSNAPPCPYDIVGGGDLTVSSPIPPSPIHDLSSAKIVVTTAAKVSGDTRYLVKYIKLMQS